MNEPDLKDCPDRPNEYVKAMRSWLAWKRQPEADAEEQRNPEAVSSYMEPFEQLRRRIRMLLLLSLLLWPLGIWKLAEGLLWLLMR